VQHAPAAPAPKPQLARLVLHASRGSCWLLIRVGSKSGRVVWEGTLEQGGTVRASAQRLWVRVGAPWNLDAWLNGKTLRTLPRNVGDVIVSPA
jgi:hypothetical protein